MHALKSLVHKSRPVVKNALGYVFAAVCGALGSVAGYAAVAFLHVPVTIVLLVGFTLCVGFSEMDRERGADQKRRLIMKGAIMALILVLCNASLFLSGVALAYASLIALMFIMPGCVALMV
jgi:hypothetical protein